MVRLLLIEDMPLDAELTVRQLKAEGIHCDWERVETEPAFRAALKRTPDLIISDCSLPTFDGLAALSIAAAEVPRTPFLFVSGTLGTERAQHAIKAGAIGWIEKGDRTRLGEMVRSALERVALPHRRVSDRNLHGDDGTGAAQHLLERRTVLDEALRHQDDSAISNIMRRAPPIPAALLMLGHSGTRDRFAKLLVGAKVEIDEAVDEEDALASLASRTHALMFTDRLELIRRARQLPAGAATHIVFVSAECESSYGEALRAGASDCMTSQARGEHFWAHMTIVRRIIDLADSLQLALSDNRILATIDELTRTGSRRFFEHQFPREVERAARLGQPLALLMCDIDHFKQINDRLGHQVGDEVLKEFADRLSKSLRAEDWIARTGGEEFAIVLPDAPAMSAWAIAERLCARISSAPFPTSKEPIVVTASFGVRALDRVPRDCRGVANDLIKAADAALYQSKHDGRNKVTAAPLSLVKSIAH